MTPNDQNDSDVLLRRTLREWCIDAPLPPRFQERVWARIQRQQAKAPDDPWTRFVQSVAIFLARPTLAVSYVSLLLVIGVLAGYLHGRADSARESQELGARYVQMLDPYLSVRR